MIEIPAIGSKRRPSVGMRQLRQHCFVNHGHGVFGISPAPGETVVSPGCGAEDGCRRHRPRVEHLYQGNRIRNPMIGNRVAEKAVGGNLLLFEGADPTLSEAF